MAYQGINTGTTQNDGTGDSLLVGGVKINDNFEELYNLLGDGINLPVGIVEEVTAGSNVSISTSYGSVEISVDEITNIDITATSMVVSGVSTLGVVTGATYYGDGSNLTGIANTENVSTNTLVVSGVSTLGVVTGATYYGDGSNLTGIVGGGGTANVSTNTLVVSGVSTLGVVTGATYYGDGSNLTGIANTANVSTNTLVVSGVSTLGIVTGATYYGDGSNLTGIVGSGGTANVSTNTLVVSGVSTLGIVTGATYYGDGSNLTGIIASGVGLTVQDGGVSRGTASIINFDSNLTVTNVSGGIATVTASAGSGSTANISADSLVVTGVSTLGIVTGATYYGDGSNLTGISGGSDSPWASDSVGIYTSKNLAVGGALTASSDYAVSAEGSARFFQIGTGNDLVLTGTGGNDGTYLFNSSRVGFVTESGFTVYFNIGVSAGGTSYSLYDEDGSVGHFIAYNIDDAQWYIYIGAGSTTGALSAGQFSAGYSSSTSDSETNDGQERPASSANISYPGSEIDDNTLVTISSDTGSISAASSITASTFYGDGSNLTGSNTLQSRTTVSGSTTSIENNGIGNTEITGFKSYALMKVGLSTAGWLRIYTDSASRLADVSRSVGEDPTPGSGVITEVVTTGISTTQIISPFVTGGNLDEPVNDTIYVAITNQSGTTQSINTNLTILKLED